MPEASPLFTLGVIVSQVVANLIQCFYGVLLVKYARGETNPIFFALLRGVVSSPVLLLIAVMFEGVSSLKLPRFEEVPYFLLLGTLPLSFTHTLCVPVFLLQLHLDFFLTVLFFFSKGNLGFGLLQCLFVMSLFLISPTLASILWQSNPIITTILAVLFHLEPPPIVRDPLSWVSLAAIISTVSGSVLVISAPMLVENDWSSIGEEVTPTPLRSTSLLSLFSASIPFFSQCSMSSSSTPQRSGQSSSSSDIAEYLLGSAIIILMTIMFAFFLVLLKKYVYLRGPPTAYQKHCDGSLYFAVVFIAKTFNWEIEEPYISPHPSSYVSPLTPPSVPTSLAVVTSDDLPDKPLAFPEVFPHSESKGIDGADIELEDVTETEEEEMEKGRKEDEERGEGGEELPHVPIGICHRWAATPIGLTCFLNFIGTISLSECYFSLSRSLARCPL
jgi:hypothetical protein